MKKKQIKMDKFDLFVIATSMFVLGMLVQKIAIYGLNCLTTIYRVQEENMDIKHCIGKSEIMDSEKEKQINEIMELLKTKKQTYLVNKFVLEETIERLQETII